MGAEDDVSTDAARELRKAILNVAIDLEGADSAWTLQAAVDGLESALEEARKALAF